MNKSGNKYSTKEVLELGKNAIETILTKLCSKKMASNKNPTSHMLKIEDIAIPELTEEEEIQQYLSLKEEK